MRTRRNALGVPPLEPAAAVGLAAWHRHRGTSRGVSIAHAWFTDKTTHSPADVKSLRANTVRVVLGGGPRERPDPLPIRRFGAPEGRSAHRTP